MTAPKTFNFLVFILIHFLILSLGVSKSPRFDDTESFLGLMSTSSKKSLSDEGTRYNLRGTQFCFGPYYEKSDLYSRATELRGLGVFAKKKILQLGKVEQVFFAIGEQSSYGEEETIIRELDLLNIPHFKVPESLGFRIFIDLSPNLELRESQMTALVSLGRPLKYVEIQSPSEIYMLVASKDDRLNLPPYKEKDCRGIASWTEFL